ncbi:unnamed protein product [Calypogeia fissa]
MAAGSSSDLETPLINDDRNLSSQSDNPGDTPSGEPKRKWKERAASGLTPLQSGRWQVKYRNYVENMDFSEVDGHTPGLREYNRRQREALAGFEEVDAITSADPSIPQLDDPRVNWAINISNALNVVLLVVKIYAVVKSGSLAILASTLDSLLDMVAGFVLWFSHFYMQRKNRYKYPIGKLRIQPVGIVVFAAAMATLGLQVLITGVEQLLEGDKQAMDAGQRIWLVVIMGLAIVVKLALYLYCKSFDNEIVNVYAMDHFFDVITNIVGLAAALLGDYFFWWIDPAGAIFLAVYTIVNWGKTLLENAVSLVGKAAPPQVLQKFTYMALNHDHRIRRIDTVRAYTFGTFYFVEVDIELPEEMPLKEAHEIGESLQNKLERLPEVERAFVHLDYDSSHRPEHFAAEMKH